MTRTTHVFRELRRNLIRNPGTAVGSFLSLLLLLLLFDLYWVAAKTSEHFYERLLGELRMDVYVSEETADSLLPSLEATFASIEGVRSVVFVSRQQARDELRRLVGTDLLAGYDTINPLPRSFVLQFSPEYLSAAAIAGSAEEIGMQAGVAEVHYSREWLQKAETTRATILKVGVTLGALILLTALISSINGIRLSSRARAIGFQQMRLLGAGRFLLGIPFLLEGMLIGGLSAVCGWLLIFYASRKVSPVQIDLVLPAIRQIAGFCAAVALLGMVSGYLGIRKLLR
ncbi:MAG TPA: permease-like cell division protein FtsX [Candidatus Deferrimicrobium sp.]|nr:permease-like cell division protein FtsX [Candidatus Deferrimicrobium sp.]